MGWIRQNRYAVVFYAVLFSFFQFCIFKLYGFSIFPDEFGYWAYAAKAAGYDWPEVVSLCSFYSCGYSVFLYPIFWLCRDAVAAYRIAVAVNFVLIGVSYWILCRIGHLFVSGGREVCQIGSAAAMFYPAVIFYAQTTMAETVLMTGYLLVLLLFAGYLRRPGYRGIVLILAVNSYMYLVHMRGRHFRGMRGADAFGGDPRGQGLQADSIHYHYDACVTVCGCASREMDVIQSVSECEQGAL